MKSCSRCKELKSISEFDVQRDKSSGLKSRCKKCCNEARRIKNNSIRPHRVTKEFISGDYPEAGFISIYVLYNEYKEVFYVGHTADPVIRIRDHFKKFGDVYMGIVKNVPFDQTVYWESKTLVEYADSGANLMNLESPKRNGR